MAATRAAKKKPKAEPAGWAWKPGARFGVKAAAAGRALEAIRRRDGAVTPGAVVDAARDPGHPLHRAFDWDDTEAAEKWRHLQARQLVNSVRVVRAGGPDRVAFVSVLLREDCGRGYLPADVVVSDDHYRAASLAEALAALAGWRRRYAHLRELAAVFAAADRVGAAA